MPRSVPMAMNRQRETIKPLPRILPVFELSRSNLQAWWKTDEFFLVPRSGAPMATAKIQPELPPPTNPNRRASVPHGRHILVVGSEPAILGCVQNSLVREDIAVMPLTNEQAMIRLQKGLVP